MSPKSVKLSLLILGVFCLQPIVNFTLANRINDDLIYSRVIVYFFLLFFSAVAIWAFLWIANRKIRATSIAIFVGSFLALVFSEYLFFPPLVELINAANLPFRTIYLIELALFLSVSLGIVCAVNYSPPARLFGAIFLGVFISWDVAHILKIEFSTLDIVEEPLTQTTTQAFFNSSNYTPNVYFILPDSHPGENVVRKLGLDTSFFSGLRERGYYVVDNAISNATVTIYSMAHLFQMELLLKNLSHVTHNTLELKGTLIDSPVVNNFRSRGYKYIHVYDGYDGPNCPDGTDICISKQHFLRRQDMSFLERSPMIRILRKLPITLNDVPLSLYYYPNRMEIPDIIKRLPSQKEGPFFLFMHLSLPHPPYRYDSECNYYDNAPYSVLAFKKQLECTSKLLPRLLDNIQAHDPNALIILQADTGELFKDEQATETVLKWPVKSINDRLSIVSAFAGPEKCLAQLKPGLSPVNTFRWVFACLDNKTPQYLPDRSWVVRYLHDIPSGKIIEWTDERKTLNQ